MLNVKLFPSESLTRFSGGEMEVTGENASDYVRLYAEYVMVEVRHTVHVCHCIGYYVIFSVAYGVSICLCTS